MKAVVVIMAFLTFPVCSHGEILLENPRNRDTGPPRQLGFSFGFPSGLNAEFFLDTRATTLSLSGMYWGESSRFGEWGVQGGLSAFRARRTNFFRALMLIGGYIKDDSDDYSYVGLEGFWQMEGVFAGLGVTLVRFEEPGMSFRIGYLWGF